MPGNQSNYTTSDRLAFVLACLAGILAIVLFLVEKTPLTVAILLLLLLAFSVYPILHFVRRRRNRWTAFALIFLAVVCFGWKTWPRKINLTDSTVISGQPSSQNVAPAIAVNPSPTVAASIKPEDKSHQPKAPSSKQRGASAVNLINADATDIEIADNTFIAGSGGAISASNSKLKQINVHDNTIVDKNVPPGTVITGPITQGPSSALSINQQGGITAGTYVGSKPAQCSTTLKSANVSDGKNFKSTFAVNIVSEHSVSIRFSATGQYVVGLTLDVSTMGLIGGGRLDTRTLSLDKISPGAYSIVVSSSQAEEVTLSCEEI
jgi:hypothetical protein